MAEAATAFARRYSMASAAEADLRRIPAIPGRARASGHGGAATHRSGGARDGGRVGVERGPGGWWCTSGGAVARRGRCVVRLVDITSFFPTSCGGIKRYYREKARVLPPRGIECHFVAPGPALEEQSLGGGTLHLLPGPRVPFSPEYRFFQPGGGHLRRLLHRLAPDIVEIGSHYFLPDMVIRALGSQRPALVGFFHTDFPRQLVEPLAKRYRQRAWMRRRSRWRGRSPAISSRATMPAWWLRARSPNGCTDWAFPACAGSVWASTSTCFARSRSSAEMRARRSRSRTSAGCRPKRSSGS